MNLLNIIILSAVEGLTEFLPISSTAHLIITSKILNIPPTDFQKLFEVFIQSGAISAVIFIYFSYLKKNFLIIKSLFLSFLPTALTGFILYKIIKNIFFDSLFLIGFSLLTVGLFFILIEFFIKKRSLKKEIKEINIKEAIIIGLGQSLAVIPGVSRAGAVIITMIILGYKREEAAIYSFLLAIPTILAASFFDFYKSRDILINNHNNIYNLLSGFLISFVFASFSVKWLINYLKKKDLIVFGIYRIFLSFLVFFL
jgi:undecaprenyl-diphosphatase